MSIGVRVVVAAVVAALIALAATTPVAAAPLPYKDYFAFITAQYVTQYQQWVAAGRYNVINYGYPAATQWVLEKPIQPFTGGFYAGTNWLLYRATGLSMWRDWASVIQVGGAPIANNTQTHDVGFNIVSTYVAGYMLTGDTSYLPIILQAAHSLATRFDPAVGCTRSWNSAAPTFEVIIDNMMNIELLYWAGMFANNNTWLDMAQSHAATTIRNHFRDNNSTFHVVVYNQNDGSVIRKRTAQGYADWSTWARGQSWAVHGYTISYRYTRFQPFLDKAIGAAKMFMDRMQESAARYDSVPLWDFDTPPQLAVREVSAAVIVASAFIELATYSSVSDPKASYYWRTAELILANVSSPKYSLMGRPDLLLPAILTQSNAAVMNSSEVSVAQSYGDYYYTQALVRYMIESQRSEKEKQIRQNQERQLQNQLIGLGDNHQDWQKRHRIMREYFMENPQAAMGV